MDNDNLCAILIGMVVTVLILSIATYKFREVKLDHAFQMEKLKFSCPQVDSIKVKGKPGQ